MFINKEEVSRKDSVKPSSDRRFSAFSTFSSFFFFPLSLSVGKWKLSNLGGQFKIFYFVTCTWWFTIKFTIETSELSDKSHLIIGLLDWLDYRMLDDFLPYHEIIVNVITGKKSGGRVWIKPGETSGSILIIKYMSCNNASVVPVVEWKLLS